MKNLIALMILAVVVFSGYIFVKKDFFSNNPVLEKNASPEIVDMSFLTKPMFLEDSFKNKQNLDHTVVVSTTKATTTTAIRTTTTKNNYTNNFEEVPQPSGIRYATYKSNKHRFEFLYNASLVIEEEDYEMAENARASIIVITTPEFVEFAKDFSGISTTEMALSLPLVEIPGAVINIWPSENGNFETYLSDVYKSDYWNRENIVNKNNIHFAKFTQKSQEEDVDSMLEREGIDYDSLDPDEKKMVDFWLSMEAAKKREFVVNFNQKIITISITGEESAKDGFVSNWKFN